MKNKIKTKNGLRQARLRAGLETKQVTRLLSKKSADEIYHYERGDNSPSLETALKLEIIYRTPVKLLFQALFERLQSEVDKIKKESPKLFPDNNWFPPHSEKLAQGEACFYAELLKTRFPSESEIKAVREHVTSLMLTMNEYLTGGNPFSLPEGNNGKDSE